MKISFFFITNTLIITIALAIIASVAAATGTEPSYGNGYLLTLEPCDEQVTSQFWTFKQMKSPIRNNEIVSLLYLADKNHAEQINCLETDANMPLPSGEHVAIPTMWTCATNQNNQRENGANFWYILNESTLQQQFQPRSCVGWETFEENELITMVDCIDNRSNAEIELVSDKTDKNIFQIRAKANNNGTAFSSSSALCIAPQRGFTDSASIESDDVRYTFSVGGFGSKINLTYLSNFQVYQGPQLGWSANLMDSSRNQLRRSHWSTSSITLSDDSWYYARGGKLTTQPAFGSNKTGTIDITDILIGPENDPIAKETWRIFFISPDPLANGASSILWQISREYLRDEIEEKVSRFATFVILSNDPTITHSTTAHQGQIPSTLDTSFQLNISSSSAFHTVIGDQPSFQQKNQSLGEQWVYVASQRKQNSLALSPADVCIQWSCVSSDIKDYPNDPAFSFQFPFFNDYPLGESGFGVISASNETQFKLVRKGAKITNTFKMSNKNGDHSNCEAANKLSFTTKNETRDENLRSLARNFNMWAGRNIGNSPRSVTCLFSSSQYGMFTSIFNPDPSPYSPLRKIYNDSSNFDFYTERRQPELFEAFRFYLEFFFEIGVNKSNGFVLTQWDMVDPIPYGYGMMQQATSFLLAIYDYAVFSGDKDFIVKNFGEDPASNPITRALGYLLKDMGLEKDGIAHTLGNSNGNNCTLCGQSSSWMDIIQFGGFDCIINAEAMQVLKGFADLATWIGRNETGNKLRDLHKRAVGVYNEKMWNEEFGLYADWIGEDGHINRYGYVWQQMLAVDASSGIASGNATRINKIFETIDKHYARVFKDYNISEKIQWCTPTNFVSVPIWHQTLWYQNYGTYENGACFMLMTAFEIWGRFNNNETKKGLELFDTTMQWYEKTRLWGQHTSPFGFNNPNKTVQENIDDFYFQGGDVLTDTTMLGFAILRGVFKIEWSLTEGLKIDNSNRDLEQWKEFAGWQWTFWYMGERTTLEVLSDGRISSSSNSPSHHGNNNKNNGGLSHEQLAGVVAGSFVGFCVIVLVLLNLKKRQLRRKDLEKGGGGSLEVQQEGEYEAVE